MFVVICRHCREIICEVDRIRAADEAQLREHLAEHQDDARSLPLGELLHYFSVTRAPAGSER
jgi:hypothetical protein